MQRTVIIKFVISKIEDEENWWFNSCVSCQAEVEKVDKKFKCPECKRSFGYSEKRLVDYIFIFVFCRLYSELYLNLNHRFRIVVLADDSTLVTNVILMDRFVKRVAGTTVANILNEIKKVNIDKCLSPYFLFMLFLTSLPYSYVDIRIAL